MKRLLTTGLALGLLVVSSFAQSIKGKPWTGNYGITETVEQIMLRDSFNPPAMVDLEGSEANEYDRPLKKSIEGLPSDATYPAGNSPIRDNRGGPLFGTLNQTISGASLGESGFVPPDSMGDVSPTQAVIFINGRIKVFNRATGAVEAINTTSDNFFNSVRVGGQCSDPRVKFDRLTQRWFMCIITVSSPNRLLLAVSNGPVITNTSSFTFFGDLHTNITPVGADAGQLLDYPTMGVDNNAIYVGGNMFNGTFHVSLFVIRKSSVLGVGPWVVTPFRDVTSGSGAGIFTAQGVDNDDPASTNGYFVGVDNSVFSRLVVRRVSNPGGTPTLSGNLNITVSSTVNPQSVASQGATAAPLSGLDDRLFAATMKFNPILGRRTIWTAHNIEVSATGAASTTGNRNGVRWYEIDNVSATPSINQSGTIFDPAASNPQSFWIPTLSVNGQGHMLCGFSIAGLTTFAGNGFAGRLVSQTLGQVDPVQFLNTSTTAYNVQSGTQRWGDYSMTTIDPLDNMTFWTTQMLCNATNSYQTRIYKVLAPPPASVASFSPNTIAQGSTANIVVTGSSTNGSGFYDPGSSFPNRLAAVFSGSGLTVNSITFTDATHFTVNVTASGSAALGLRTMTVTNPDGQQTASTGGVTVITGANPLPTLTSLSTTVRSTLSPSFTLIVTGTNFVSDSVVRWNGVNLATTFNSATQLSAVVPAANLLVPASVPVTVFTPAPGGGTSNSILFSVVSTTFSGIVTLNNWIPDEAGKLANVSIFNGPTLVSSNNVTLGAGGAFNLSTNIAPGAYSAVIAVSPHWLAKSVTVNVGTNGSVTGVNASLTNGDCDGDNEIGPGDFAQLSLAFGATLGDSNYDANADLDGDEEVGPSDFGILAGSFGQMGD